MKSVGWRYAALLAVCACVWRGASAARVLIVVPTPSISHQVVFRPVAQELARRGHRIVVLTTDPAFPRGQAPPNLTEIDLHNVSYVPWINRFLKTATGKGNDLYTQLNTAYDLMIEIFAKQMRTEAVRALLADEKEQFDLVISEAWPRPALALAHVYNTKVIAMSSLGGLDENYEIMGAPIDPVLYPDFLRTRLNNLTLWEKATELFNRFQHYRLRASYEEEENAMLREVFGADMPPLHELKKKVELLFLNVDPIFEGYRPVPPNVIHLGGLNCAPPKELPQELKSLMDSSEHGVIYMSFGTNVDPSLLPPDRLAIFARVFAQLPYDVLWKWKNPPEGLPANVHTFDWLPQNDLLHQKKVVLFITQAGLQSTDEALRAGVPLLALPMLGDQWYNAEQYERLGVGKRLDITSLTDHQLRTSIELVINDQSYRSRSQWVGEEMQDRPQSALARAVWWVERVLRRRGPQLRAPATRISYLRCLPGDLLLAALALLAGVVLSLLAVFKIFMKQIVKVKTN